MDTLSRRPYLSDVFAEERAFVAPYLTLTRLDAPQRQHDPREVFNTLRWTARTEAPWTICRPTSRRGKRRVLPGRGKPSAGLRPGSSKPCLHAGREDRGNKEES